MNDKKTVAVAALCAASCAFGAFERTVEATDGIGDVVALTNALAELNALSKASGGGDTLNARIWLKPGLYDLKGVCMAANSHLRIEHARNFVFAGLGDGPEDTVLLGGGEAEGCRVISVSGGGNYWWNTYSNLTVTGGYVTSGSGGGIYSGSLATRYVRLIVSNNVTTATTRYSGGGGICGGVAEQCLFVDNRAGIAGGAFEPNSASKTPPGETEPSVRAYATDCVFSNNQVTATYSASYAGGAVTGGTYTRCKFYGNTSASYGGAVGRSEVCPSAVLIDCELVGNVAANGGGGAYNPVGVTNCTFVGNTLSNWGSGGAIYAGNGAVDVVGCVFTGGGAARGCIGFNVNFTDCIMTNNAGTFALYNANLTRCYVAGNSASEGAAVVDFVETANSRTNVNCVFVGNSQSNYGSLSSAKVIVNCAYLDNTYGNANYSPLFSDAALVYNSVFSGNRINNGTPCDIRTWSERYPTLVNCVFSTTDGDVDGVASYTDCRQVARERLRYTKRDAARPLMPSRRSPLYDGGYEADWLLALVGDTDCYGRARRLFARLDIGPAECDEEPMGLAVIIR